MTKEVKEKKEQQQEQPVEHTDVDAVTPKKRKKHHLVSFLIFLILAGGIFTAFYFFTPIVLSSNNPQKLSVLTASSHVVSPSLQTNEEEVMIALHPHYEGKIYVAQEIVPDTQENASEEVPFVPKTSDDVPAALEPEVFEEPQTVEVVPQKTPAYGYSVLKAIQLRDALKQEEECRPLLEELMALPGKTPEIDKALMNLLQACLDRPIAEQMQKAFMTAKKRAILRIFQNDNPTYIAYLKALPYFIADVHRKNPTTETPLDILSRLQNAVYSDRPQLVLKLIPELPENVQVTLYDVQQYASKEAELYHSFNQIMRILFSQGGAND